MIKVGQVYESDGFKYIITKVSARNHDVFIEHDGFIEKVYDIIWENGEVISSLSEKVIKIDELLAEYSTWQEAVNSPEFRGEN